MCVCVTGPTCYSSNENRELSSSSRLQHFMRFKYNPLHVRHYCWYQCLFQFIMVTAAHADPVIYVIDVVCCSHLSLHSLRRLMFCFLLFLILHVLCFNDVMIVKLKTWPRNNSKKWTFGRTLARLQCCWFMCKVYESKNKNSFMFLYSYGNNAQRTLILYEI